MEIGEKAGKLLEYMINDLLKDIKGKKFSQEGLEILTLCVSELIKASFCPSHYEKGIDKAIDLIKKDFE